MYVCTWRCGERGEEIIFVCIHVKLHCDRVHVDVFTFANGDGYFEALSIYRLDQISHATKL